MLSATDLDTGFGNGGFVATDVAGGLDAVHAVAVQKDGKIIAAGEAEVPIFDGESTHIERLSALIRDNTDGTLDDGSAADLTPGDRFGTDGKVILQVPGAETGGRIFTAALTADGKLVVGGSDDQVNPANPDGSETGAFVARLNVNGTPDTSFGNGGFAVATLGSTLVAEFRGIALLGDGRIVAVGSSDRKWAIARFTDAGALDRTFSGDGYDALYWSGSNDVANGVAIDNLGNAVVAGNAFDSIAVARYRPDGVLDSNFSADGKATYFDYPGPFSHANSVAVSAGGQIVVVGDSTVAHPGYDPIIEPGVFRFTARGERYVGNAQFEPTLVLDLPGSNAAVLYQANDEEVVGGSLQNGSDTEATLYTADPRRQHDYNSVRAPIGRAGPKGYDAFAVAVAVGPAGQFVEALRTPATDGNFVIARFIGNPTSAWGSIAGRVFHDDDADGVQDVNEVGFTNVRVYADANGNGAFDAGEPDVLTDAAGNLSSKA